MGESTDSNYSVSSKDYLGYQKLCSFKERACSRLRIIDSPFCALHTIGHLELPYVQCCAQSDSFQCKRVIHIKMRSKYCPYHANIKMKSAKNSQLTDTQSNSSATGLRRSFSVDMSKHGSKSDEAKSLIEGLYKAKDREAYFDRFSSDGESIDSEGSDDLLKHASSFSTDELFNQSINRWTKYLNLCYEALGELRYEMMENYRDMLYNDCDVKGPDSENPIILNSPRLPEELKAYRKFLSIPKKETMHANNAMLQKFMTNYRSVKHSGYCQYPVIKTGSAKDRCNELVIPCSNYCLHHLVAKGEAKNRPNAASNTTSAAASSDKFLEQVLFKKCEGGPDKSCTEVVVKWNPDSRCPLHTGFEDAIYDPIISNENKIVLQQMEDDISSMSHESLLTSPIKIEHLLGSHGLIDDDK